MQTVDIEINKIKPYWNNPRKNDQGVAALMESLKEFGFQKPIVVDTDYVIICGHTTFKAAKRLGYKSIPCKIADELTPEQAKAFRLVDNKTAELSEWDFDKLKIEIGDLNLSDYDIDLSLFGFDRDLLMEEAQEDDFDFDAEYERITNAVTQRGDVWKLGENRLMCGDATSPSDVEKLLGGEKVDCYLTDPPYNVDYEGKAGKIKNDNMPDEAFRQFLTAAFGNAEMNMKPGAAFYIWHADSEGYNFRGACRDADLQVRECLIWKKNSFVMGRQDYQWQHEPCLYGWKAGGAHYWYGDRRQSTILSFDRPAKSKIHPTMKPVRLFDYLIRNSTVPGANVLDTFAGSGTTLITSIYNKRSTYSLELDCKCCDVIIKRWEALTGLRAERIIYGQTEEKHQ